MTVHGFSRMAPFRYRPLWYGISGGSGYCSPEGRLNMSEIRSHVLNGTPAPGRSRNGATTLDGEERGCSQSSLRHSSQNEWEQVSET